MFKDEESYEFNFVLEPGGETLADRHKVEHGWERVKEDVCAVYTYQVCRGLRFIHRCKVIHRDIKPENIFAATGSNVIKIGDFGESKLTSMTMDDCRTIGG